MSDNKETKQAPAVEAGARDDLITRLLLAGRHPDWSICMEAASALARASEAAAGEPVAWMMKHKTGPDVGLAWKKDDPKFSSDWLRFPLVHAAPQPASEQQADHVLVPRELLQDLIDDVEEYAASREFKAREVVWRDERIGRAREILAAKGDGHAD